MVASSSILSEILELENFQGVAAPNLPQAQTIKDSTAENLHDLADSTSSNSEITADDCLGVARKLAKAQKLDLAITYYGRTLQQQPLLDAYLELGQLLTKVKAGSKAIAVYLQGLKYHSDCPELYFNLGNLYKLSQQFPQAAICYQKTCPIRFTTRSSLPRARRSFKPTATMVGSNYRLPQSDRTQSRFFLVL